MPVTCSVLVSFEELPVPFATVAWLTEKLCISDIGRPTLAIRVHMVHLRFFICDSLPTIITISGIGARNSAIANARSVPKGVFEIGTEKALASEPLRHTGAQDGVPKVMP